MTQTVQIQEEVDLYVCMGVSVIPLASRSKRPLIDWKPYQRRHPSDQELEQWFSDGENNIGVVCGGISGNLVVLDVDKPELLSLRPLAELASKTAAVKTSRGLHIWIRSLTLARIIHRPYGLDVLSDGSYVLAPPSIHPDGTQYTFASDCRSIIEMPDVNKLIAWLDQHYNYHSNGSLNTPLVGNGHIIEGERNNTLFQSATVDREQGFPVDVAVARAQQVNLQVCKPPLPPCEVTTLVRSAYSRPYHENAAQKVVSDSEQSRVYFDRDGKFIPKRLADELLGAFEFKTTSDTREVYVYDGAIWQPKGETLIHAECQKRLGEETHSRRVSEVQDYIRGETYVERDIFNADLDLINLENGVLNVLTSELKPHSPKYLFTYKLPLIYDPEAKCPEIEKFLLEVQPDEKHRQGMIELAGYCLYRYYLYHLAWMLTGNGANGKSTYINLLKCFLAIENVVGISLHELEEDRFAVANLYGKLANLYPDLPSRALKQTGKLKMCTGGDMLTGQKKFKDRFNFVNCAKFVFSANTVPRSPNDDSDAFFRRWVIIPFPNKFEGDNRDEHKLAKLTTPTELSGFLNLALKALRDVLKNGGFTNDEPTEQKRTRYIRLSDPVASFVMDCIDASPNDFILKDLLYQEFVDYCKQNHYVILPKPTFCKALTKEAPVEDYRPEINKTRPPAWKGIKLRSEEDKEKDRGTLDEHL